MTTFDDREKAYEKKFALDQDLKFRAESRRNKMLGEWAGAKLGKTGAALYERARGRDSRPVRAREVPLSVSRETSLEQPTADRAWLESMLFYLLERACRAVRMQGLRARGLRVKIRYSDGFENEAALSFGPTAYDADLEPLARGLLAKLYTRRVTLRLVGIQLDEPGIPRHGHTLWRDGRQVGVVTSGTKSPTLGTFIGMAYVETASTPVWTAVEVDIRGRRLPARVVAKPFYRRKPQEA